MDQSLRLCSKVVIVTGRAGSVTGVTLAADGGMSA
jgi:hypothetical protein